MSDCLDDLAHECGVDALIVQEWFVQPARVAERCEKLVRGWALYSKSNWPALCPGRKIQHSKALDTIAQVVGLRDYQAFCGTLRSFEASYAREGHCAEGSATRHQASELLSAYLPLKIRLRQDEHPSLLQGPHLSRLAHRLSELVGEPLKQAEAFLVQGMRQLARPRVDRKSEDLLGDIEPDESHPCYEFQVSGSPAMGNFVPSYAAIVTERDIRSAIEGWRSGSWGMEHVLETIAIRSARLCGFFAGKVILADLLLERGDTKGACAAYEEGAAMARSLMPEDYSHVLVAHGGANDFYLLGLENLARAQLYLGDFARARQTLRDLHRHAFVDEDAYAQCLPAVVASASFDDKLAPAMLSLAGEVDSRPLTSLVRALVYCGARRFDEAAEALADAVVRRPALATAFTTGIAEDDKHFRNGDLEFVLERRPDVRERMTRALAAPGIQTTLASLRDGAKPVGSFKRQVLHWPDDEPIPAQVKRMRDSIRELTPILSRAMQEGGTEV